MSISLSELETQRERLKLQLSNPGDLRPGSLVERFSPATVGVTGTVGSMVSFQEGSRCCGNWPASA